MVPRAPENASLISGHAFHFTLQRTGGSHAEISSCGWIGNGDCLRVLGRNALQRHQTPGSVAPRPASFYRDKPLTPPYLVETPDVIPIDVGRQLFVDDFLIAETTLKRTFHQPEFHPACPIFKAEKTWEIRRDTGSAAPFSGGVWYDPADGTFKMWYMAGTGCFFGYATSLDGIHWERPKLDTTRFGDNVLDIEPIQRDSSTVWLDLEETDPAQMAPSDSLSTQRSRQR